MTNSEEENETFGESEQEFLSHVQSRITSLERELDDLKRSFTSFVLEMGPERPREFKGEDLRYVKDAVLRVLAFSGEPLTVGQVHEQFDKHSRVYGVTRKELHLVLTRMAQGTRSVVRRFRKGSASRVVLYELRHHPKGLWHQGRYWTASDLARDPLLNKNGLSERTIRDRMKAAEFIHQVLDAPAVSRGPGARSQQPKGMEGSVHRTSN